MGANNVLPILEAIGKTFDFVGVREIGGGKRIFTLRNVASGKKERYAADSTEVIICEDTLKEGQRVQFGMHSYFLRVDKTLE